MMVDMVSCGSITADTLEGKFYSLTPTDQAAGLAEKIDDFELDLRKHQIV